MATKRKSEDTTGVPSAKKQKKSSRTDSAPENLNQNTPPPGTAPKKIKRHSVHEQSSPTDVTTAGDDATSNVLNNGHASHPTQNFPSSHSPPAPATTETSSPSLQPQDFPPLPPITNPSLAQAPFTHAGVDHQTMNYERLEFLGDAYIELFASELIFAQCPHLSPGRMSQTREALVRNKTLAGFSLAYRFDEQAQVSASHKTPGGDRFKTWEKLLGDMFEAYVAAVILSDPAGEGYAAAKKWLTALWMPLLPGVVHEPPEKKDAKQDLARKVLGRGVRLVYRDEGMQREASMTWYIVGVYITGWGWTEQFLGSGRGLNKSEAGVRAAMRALTNPLSAQIGAVKRDYDAKVRAEREQEESVEPSGDNMKLRD